MNNPIEIQNQHDAFNKEVDFGVSMQVVVLAGGIGSRLRPWTNHYPKPLLPMLDSRLLERVIECMPSELVDEVIIAGGYKVDMIEDYYKKSAMADFDITIVPETEPLGTGGALGNCRDVVSGRFACFNGDIVSSLDFGSMLAQHEKSNAKGTLGLWEVEDPTRFGIVGLDQNNFITQFKEKPKPEEVFSNLINAGSYILEDSIFDIMPKEKHSLEREIFPQMAERGELTGFPFKGYFIDAGTPESWHQAIKRCIAENKFKTGSVSNGSWHELEISTSRNSMIQQNCTILGDVEESTILQNSIIGKGSIVKNCLIGEDVLIGDNCNLESVIVGHGVTVPPGYSQTSGIIE